MPDYGIINGFKSEPKGDTMHHSIARKVVEVIEESPFRPAEKFHLLTTVLGLRSACWVGIRSAPWPPGGAVAVPLETEWAAAHAVSQLGLHVVQTTREIEGNEIVGDVIVHRHRVRVEFIVAHTEEMADDLEGLLKVVHTPINPVYRQSGIATRLTASRNIGYHMGYPRSAVQAYSAGAMHPPQMVSDEIFPPELRPFFCFAFSRENVVEEVAVLRQWVEACAEVSPKIHAEVLASEPPA